MSSALQLRYETMVMIHNKNMNNSSGVLSIFFEWSVESQAGRSSIMEKKTTRSPYIGPQNSCGRTYSSIRSRRTPM